MTQSGGKMTVVAAIKPYSSDTNVPVRISCSTGMADITVTANDVYTVTLDCLADENQKVTIATTESGKRVIVTQVDIYSSTPNGSKLLFSIPVQEGDSTTRTITGITDKFYTVTDLTAGGTFNYKVKAHYTNGTQSEWSNLEVVTLFENTPTVMRGDVNGLGQVDMDDLTVLINYLLDDTTVINTAAAASCNNANDTTLVDMDDLTALINFLLTDNWAN